MIRVVLFVYLLLLFACKSEKQKEEYSAPGKNDINEVIRTIIREDSLNKKKIPLSADLRKITVSLKEVTPSRRGFDTMSVKRLLGRGHDEQYFFSKRDSSYFLFQNGAIKSLKLDSPFLKIMTLMSSAQIQKNERSDLFFRHYDLSLPIFSLDRKKAVVEFNYYCKFCGFGMLIYLERINGKWEIIKQEETWVS
jgi:hypothetical protein